MVTTSAPHIQRRRLPPGLRMTSAIEDAAEPEHPPRHGQWQGYDTPAEIPTTPMSIKSFTSSMSAASSSCAEGCSSAFGNAHESISRTQQKLMLQRASSQEDMDEDEMSHRSKTLRDMERIQRDYRCVRMFSNPLLDSLARCQAKLDQEKKEREQEHEQQEMGSPQPQYLYEISY
ncbi:hypothetical protein B0O80DRAFT_449757 [Mortierella sp. GBAus27b]|nr:hypothetical protein B0O80DRAFT_449757 [Mortierella sp. GBAus27b]